MCVIAATFARIRQLQRRHVRPLLRRTTPAWILPRVSGNASHPGQIYSLWTSRALPTPGILLSPSPRCKPNEMADSSLSLLPQYRSTVKMYSVQHHKTHRVWRPSRLCEDRTHVHTHTNVRTSVMSSINYRVDPPRSDHLFACETKNSDVSLFKLSFSD